MRRTENSQNVITRQWLQQALLKLIETHSLKEIKITALTKTAGVARVTFYRNYTDISDVIFDYLRMQEFGLAPCCGDRPKNTSGSSAPSRVPDDEELRQRNTYLPQFIRSYFEFFSKNRNLFICIEENNLQSRLMATLSEQINANAYMLISAYGFENRYEVSALVGMFSRILLDWTFSGMKESIEDMTVIVFKIINKFNCVPVMQD